MTALQKSEIIRMRGAGETYAAIADTLNLSVNTVQSFCRRQSSAEKEKENPSPKCENCRKPMKQTAQTTRRFCCDACRMKWWSKHPEERPGKKAVCVQCGKKFSYQGSRSRKFCSQKCYRKSKAVAV